MEVLEIVESPQVTVLEFLVDTNVIQIQEDPDIEIIELIETTQVVEVVESQTTDVLEVIVAGPQGIPGEQGIPGTSGFIVLELNDPIPPGTPPGTVIIRKTS